MAVSALSAVPSSTFTFPGELAPHANISFTAGVGPYDVLHEWDTVSSFDSGALITDANNGITLVVDEGVPPSDMGPVGTTWYYRCKVTDTDDSDVQTSSTVTLEFAGATAQPRTLYMAANVGHTFVDPDTMPRTLYVVANVGHTFADPDSEDRFLYVAADINDEQPPPNLVLAVPDILEMGETVTISGWNYEGRDDGGDMDPEIRFYSGSDISGSYQVLTPVEWTLSTNRGVLMDEVEALMPNPPPILPATGYLVMIHTGADKNPYRAYSNFFAVVVRLDEQTLAKIDFAGTDIGWPTSASMGSYWTGSASLSKKLYVTSKRGAPWSFDGTDIEAFATSGFVDPPETDEVQKCYNDATGGEFQFTRLGNNSSSIVFNAAAAVVKAAVEELPDITTVTVTGAGTEADPWVITFDDPGSTDIAILTTDDTDLTGGTVGTTFIEFAPGGQPGDITNSFPQGFHAARAHDRLWVANVKYLDGTQHTSRLHYSGALAPEAWWAEDYVDFDPDDGQEITGLMTYGEGLLVFKNHNIQMLTGMSEASFARQTLISNTGTVSPYSIAIVGGILLFVDRDSGVWTFNGAEFEAVSDNIRTYLLEGMNYGAMFSAAGFSYRNKYVLSVPWGTDTHPTKSFVYDLTTKAWTEYDFGFRDAVAARDFIYSVAPAADLDGVFQMNTGEKDEGVEIDAEFETPWIAPGGHSNKHRTRRLDLAFANLGGAVKIGQYNDFDPTVAVYETTKTVSDPTSDQVLNVLGGFSGTRWETMQLKVENIAGSDFQLNRVVLLWTALSRQRGSDE